MSAPIIYVCMVHHEADWIVECEIYDSGAGESPELYGLRMRIDAKGSTWEPYDEACWLDKKAIDVGVDIAGLCDPETGWLDAFALYAKEHGVDK